MIPKNWLMMSRRPCPACGGLMQYKPTLVSWLTQRYRRACTKCTYVDRIDVKL
jgi:ribosomal protein S27AE